MFGLVYCFVVFVVDCYILFSCLLIVVWSAVLSWFALFGCLFVWWIGGLLFWCLFVLLVLVGLRCFGLLF